MREIKFRAWDKKGKRIRYILDGLHCDFNFCNPQEFWNWSKEEYILMQYTGLKDKNGVEIYEGDIVQYCTWKPKDIRESKEGVVSYVLGDTGLWLSTYDQSKLEVIGNVYENPKLKGEI